MEKVDTMKKEKDIIFDEETIKSLMKSEQDIKAGRTRDAREVMREFKRRYGF